MLKKSLISDEIEYGLGCGWGEYARIRIKSFLNDRYELC